MGNGSAKKNTIELFTDASKRHLKKIPKEDLKYLEGVQFIVDTVTVTQ